MLSCEQPLRQNDPDLCGLTCDDAGEGAAHGHRGEGGGGPAERRHDRGRSAERREGGAVAVVAVVVHLHGGRVAHQGGVRAVGALVDAGRRGIGVVGPVLERRTLVLFTPDTSHRGAWREQRKWRINAE